MKREYKMLIRSSSTPLLGSLISDSPNHNHNHQTHEAHKHTPAATCVVSSSTNGNGAQDQFTTSLIKSTCQNGFRRVQSDGNLEALPDDALNYFSNKLGRRRRNSITTCCTIMSSIPSSYEYHDDDDEQEEEEEEELHDIMLKAAMPMMTSVDQTAGDGEGKMYLATGLGGGNGGGRGSCYRPVAFDRGGGMEEHYKKMLEQDPGNSLVLRNYAHFLYKVACSLLFYSTNELMDK